VLKRWESLPIKVRPEVLELLLLLESLSPDERYKALRALSGDQGA
jgi:hypothetical protein